MAWCRQAIWNCKKMDLPTGHGGLWGVCASICQDYSCGSGDEMHGILTKFQHDRKLFLCLFLCPRVFEGSFGGWVGIYDEYNPLFHLYYYTNTFVLFYEPCLSHCVVWYMPYDMTVLLVYSREMKMDQSTNGSLLVNNTPLSHLYNVYTPGQKFIEFFFGKLWNPQ